MIELDQMKLELQQYETPLEEVRDSLDLDYKKQRIEELSRESEAPDFWNDADGGIADAQVSWPSAEPHRRRFQEQMDDGLSQRRRHRRQIP